MEKVTGETIQIKKKPEYSPHSGSDSGSYRSETRRDERRGKGQNDKERQESAYKEKGEDRTSRKMDKDVGSQRSRTGDKGSGRKDDKSKLFSFLMSCLFVVIQRKKYICRETDQCQIFKNKDKLLVSLNCTEVFKVAHEV